MLEKVQSILFLELQHHDVLKLSQNFLTQITEEDLSKVIYADNLAWIQIVLT